MRTFLDERRLLHGPWQMFERDVARLLVCNGFEDVRLVAGPGDKGADVVGSKSGAVWVIQCKYTQNTPPPREAVQEVVEAARFYNATRLIVATSRTAGQAVKDEVERHGRLGLHIELAGPSELLSLAGATPEYPPASQPLRGYQETAAHSFRNALTTVGRAQLVLATGLGKTVVMADVVANLARDGALPNGTALILAHTRELVEQLHRSFWYHLPKWLSTHHLGDGERPAFFEGVTFATIQSVVNQVGNLPPVDLILVDEAHHIGSPTYQRIIRKLQAPMLGGVTATPWRGDQYDLDSVLGEPVFQMGIAEGLAAGFLAETDYRLLADNIDWDVVQSLSANKYSLSQLNKLLLLPTRDEVAVREILQVFRSEHRRAAIVFCPSVLHAEQFAAMLRRYGFRAEMVVGGTNSRERDKTLSAFRTGQIQVVTTVDLLNEGIDVPDVDMIVFMRATHSRRIFVQQLGRGLRISRNKDKVVVLDFVTDLRRIAEVVELDRAVRGGSIETVSLGSRLISFADQSAGTFMREWMLDQADLLNRVGDSDLELPQLNFPVPRPPGAVQ